MKIEKVVVEYSELRSCGDFSNKKYGLAYEAKLETYENSDDVRRALMEQIVTDVKRLHGDEVGGKSAKITLVEESLF